MTDAEFGQLKDRIDTIADEWLKCLGLQWWKLSFHYHRDSVSYHESCPEDISLKSQAYTSVSWAYLDATIHFNLPLCIDSSDVGLEEMVIHECMHILVHEMRSVTNCECEQFDIRHEERVCTTLQRAFAWTKEHFLHMAHTNETPTLPEEIDPDAGEPHDISCAVSDGTGSFDAPTTAGDSTS